MKKIAYIFHGHARTWESCYSSFFENIFSENPGDIFIHTWNKLNTQIGQHWAKYQNLTDEQIALSNSLVDIEKIKEVYKPVQIFVEPDPGITLSESDDNQKKAAHGVKNMLYGSRKAFEYAKNHNKYDIFFSLRLDILWESKLVDIDSFDTNTLWCPILQWAGGQRRAWDVFMFGTQEQIDIKTQYLYNIDKYWFNDNTNPENTLYEDALTNYLTDNKINYNDPNITWRLNRLF